MIRMNVRTKGKREFVEITREVSAEVSKSGVKNGILLVYCPHTTAAITINENADPAVMRDINMKTTSLVPEDDPEYTHGEGNSDGHVKSTLFGASEAFIVENGQVMLGTWQGIYFSEFDGPRSRSVYLKLIEG